MEPEVNHLVHQYVEQFALEHFEDVPVKKEIGIMDRLPSMPLSCGGGVVSMVQSPPHHLLTPPGHGHDDYSVVTMGPHHPESMIMDHGGALIYPDTLSTPPDTPPESSSPHSPSRHYHHDHQHHPQERAVEDMVWTQPLDLRPNCGTQMVEDWGLHHNPVITNSGGSKFHHHHHDLDETSLPQPGRSVDGSTRTIEELFNEDLLTCLSVRDLNKRLQGYPRDVVVKLKQKRRTLKNRGYAQNCRSKRLHQRHELEMMNRDLQNEVHRLKQELNRTAQEKEMYKQERDMLKQRLEIISRKRERTEPPEVYM